MVRRLASGPSEWRVVAMDPTGLAVPFGSDMAAWAEGCIAIVPMRVDGVDHEKLMRWDRAVTGLPAWIPPGG